MCECLSALRGNIFIVKLFFSIFEMVIYFSTYVIGDVCTANKY